MHAGNEQISLHCRSEVTLWIVSGYLRSGTSAMMRALAAGGMKVAHSVTPTELSKNRTDNTYVLNPGLEVYEFKPEQLRHPLFIPQHQGEVVKILATIVPAMRWRRSVPMSTVFMMRDPVEVAASLRALRNARVDVKTPAEIALIQQAESKELRVLCDGRCIEVDYNDMIADPVRAFQRIKKGGWPIDVEAAAAVINAKEKRHYRHREPALQHGTVSCGR